MSITIGVFLFFLLVFSVSIKLGYDPLWFLSVCVAGGVCAYLMTTAPIHITWWIIAKIAGN